MRIAYGPHELQFGDLLLPDEPAPHPVVVVIHGGFWRAAFALDHIAKLCDALTAAGFATWNLEYRRIGNGGGWPVTFEDVAMGARFVKTLAATHPLDPQKVIAVGHSAGGHLALLLGAHQLVKGVVSLAGVADLKRAAELNLSRGVVNELVNGPEDFPDASPIELLPVKVPVRLVHGLNDDVVPYEIAARYANAARALGCDVELIPLENAGHSEVIDPQSVQWPAVLEQIERISAMV